MSALPMKRIDAPRRRQSRDITDGLQRRRRQRGRTARRDRIRGLVRRDGLTTAELPAVTPTLRVVPRRRLAANAAAVVVVVIGVMMLFAVVLQTRMTERQTTIDKLEQQVSAEHARFDVLRQHRASLRSPVRLSDEADRLGMAPAQAATFSAIDPMALARVLAATGLVDTDTGLTVSDHDPLAQVRRVRAAAAGVDLDGNAAADQVDEPAVASLPEVLTS